MASELIEPEQAFQFLLALVLIIFVWCAVHLFVLILAWIKSVMIAKKENPFFLDLRKDTSMPGKTIVLSAIKANPRNSVWFGHMWVVWPEPPPLAEGGAKEAGYYAHCKIAAARGLILSILSPLAIFFGQKPIDGVMRDDAGIGRDWQLMVQIDQSDYERALEIDSKWRRENRYAMRPGIGGKTYTCRDYVFEIASSIGLKPSKNNWAQFPPETFMNFLAENGLLARSTKFVF